MSSFSFWAIYLDIKFFIAIITIFRQTGGRNLNLFRLKPSRDKEESSLKFQLNWFSRLVRAREERGRGVLL